MLNKHPLEVLLYTLLYSAFLGLVNHPIPRGAFRPRLWRITRFTDVLAAILFLMDGMRKPNFKRILELKN